MKDPIRPETVAGLLAALRDRRPTILILGRRNSRAVPRVLRALGAIPVSNTSHRALHVGRGIDVLLVSPFTGAAARRQIVAVLVVARQHGVPTVIDLTGALKNRRFLAPVRGIIAGAGWPVVCGTAAELAVLTRRPMRKSADPVRVAGELLQSGGLAAIRGSTGLITDGTRSVGVDAWNDWLHTSKEAGPLTSASIAAFLGVAHLADFITAAAAAMAHLGEATNRAAQSARPQGIGSRVIKELAR